MLENIYAYIIKLIVEEDGDGWFYAYCPGLSGVHAGGETEQEALDIAKEMVNGILEIHLERGETLPESESIIALRKIEPVSLKEFKNNSFLFPVPPPHIAKELTDSESRL
jgi:Uncharacterized conserved protein